MNRLEELECKKTRRCRLKALTMLAAVCAVHAGCTPGHRLETASARGTVTLDGMPLSAGSVVLLPERGRSASSVLAKDGSFVLSTYGSGDGAIVGKHKVVVYPLASDSESNTPPPGYVPGPARYQNAATSSLEVEVKAGTENVFELKLVDMPSNGG